jgi:hypothetical protein
MLVEFSKSPRTKKKKKKKKNPTTMVVGPECEVKVQYPSERAAGIAAAALGVDPEVRPERSARTLATDGAGELTMCSGRQFFFFFFF